MIRYDSLLWHKNCHRCKYSLQSDLLLAAQIRGMTENIMYRITVDPVVCGNCLLCF